MTGEPTNSRWHGRAGFLFTILLVLLTVGAPFMVTRGLLAHGALFLPAILLLLLFVGSPLVRLALATGQLDRRLEERRASMGVQALIRLALVGVLLVVGGRAASWVFAELVFTVPDGALAFRGREFTTAATAWHTSWLYSLSPAFWAGAAVTLCLVGVVWAMAARRGLAGFSWIAVWLLPLLGVLMALALVVGVSFPGAGALASLATPLDWEAAGRLAFWGDAVGVVLLALGAQTGILTAGGLGLPKRANIGREARILVAGSGMLLVLGGMAGLLLLCAACVEQGIVPGPEHAAPEVLVMEVVPALGVRLLPGWPEGLMPSGRQIQLGWCFLVALASAVGAAALLGSRSLLPRPFLGRGAVFGYAALATALAGVVIGLAAGDGRSWLPLLTVMPALLAVLHVTLARRSGGGMRVVSAAFSSSRPWLERLHVVTAFQVVRPLLLLAVVAVALSQPEHSLVIGTFALTFALMWVGSLGARRRSRRTGLLKPVSAAILLCVMLAPAYAESSEDADPVAGPAMEAFRRLSKAGGGAPLKPLVEEFERAAMRGAPFDAQEIAAWIDKLLAVAADEQRPLAERRRANAEARASLACLALVEPESEAGLRFERTLLAADGLAPFARIDEAISAHQHGNPAPLIELLKSIHEALSGDHLGPALERDVSLPRLLAALVRDLRDAYGAAAPATRELRRYVLQRATQGRTLFKPDPGPGVAYLLSVLAAAGALAAALGLGIGRARR